MHTLLIPGPRHHSTAIAPTIGSRGTGSLPHQSRQFQVGGSLQICLRIRGGFLFALFNVIDRLGGRDPLLRVLVVARMQQGKSPDVNTFSALTRWLNIPAERFYAEQPHHPAPHEDPMAVISSLLRGKKKMNPKAVAALQELVSAAFKLSKELK